MSESRVKKTWGGARCGAGRKKEKYRSGPSHHARTRFDGVQPVHVVLRARVTVPRLRDATGYNVIRVVLSEFLDRSDFRVVHLSIQTNHLHLLVEADGDHALSRGMQGLSIQLARAINAAYGHVGKVFERRYHATLVTTAKQARFTLAYVLNNWRRHREDLISATTMKAKLDPYASGVSFDGWSGVRFVVPTGYIPLPVSPASTSLLRNEWLRYGRIDPFECPGPLW